MLRARVVRVCSTIGYGDVSPHSKVGKFIGAALVAFGLLVFSVLITEMSDMLQARRMGEADKSLDERLTDLREVIAQDDNGTVTQEEYILFCLRKMGKVDMLTLDLLRDQFKALDADGSGALDDADIRMLKKACSRQQRQQRKAGAASDATRSTRARVGAEDSSYSSHSSPSVRPYDGSAAKLAASVEGLHGAFKDARQVLREHSRREGAVAAAMPDMEPNGPPRADPPRLSSRSDGGAATSKLMPSSMGPGADGSLSDRTLSYLERTRLDSSAVSRYLGDALRDEQGDQDPESPDAVRANRGAAPTSSVGREYGTPFSRVIAGVFGGEATTREAPRDATRGADRSQASEGAGLEATAASSARIEQMLQTVLANQSKILSRVEAGQSESDFLRRRHDATMERIAQDVSNLRDWVVGDVVAKLHSA